jgi:hypothetical protein
VVRCELEFLSTIPRLGREEKKSNSPPCPRKKRGDKDGAASLLAYFLDAVFQHVHRDVRFFFRYYQRGAEADGAGAAAQEEDALFEGALYDLIALGGGVLFGGLVFDDVDADHEAAAADVAN